MRLYSNESFYFCISIIMCCSGCNCNRNDPIIRDNLVNFNREQGTNLALTVAENVGRGKNETFETTSNCDYTVFRATVFLMVVGFAAEASKTLRGKL